MGMRQPVRISPAPVYGLPAAVATRDDSGGRGGVVALLLLVLALAAATVWFVALPALEEQPAGRSCEVVVLESGSPACVREPARASEKPAHNSGRTKH